MGVVRKIISSKTNRVSWQMLIILLGFIIRKKESIETLSFNLKRPWKKRKIRGKRKRLKIY